MIIWQQSNSAIFNILDRIMKNYSLYSHRKYIYIYTHVKYKQNKFFWTPPPISLTEHMHEYLSEKLDSFSKFQDNLSKSYLRYPLLYTCTCEDIFLHLIIFHIFVSTLKNQKKPLLNFVHSKHSQSVSNIKPDVHYLHMK